MNLENLLILQDTTTKKSYGFYYRLAEVDEWIEYGRQRLKISREKDEDLASQSLMRLHIDWGEKIIEGVKEGDFDFSSDPGSEKFDPEWKTVLKKRFYYLFPPLIDYAFRGGAVAEKN